MTNIIKFSEAREKLENKLVDEIFSFVDDWVSNNEDKLFRIEEIIDSLQKKEADAIYYEYRSVIISVAIIQKKKFKKFVLDAIEKTKD